VAQKSEMHNLCANLTVNLYFGTDPDWLVMPIDLMVGSMVEGSCIRFHQDSLVNEALGQEPPMGDRPRKLDSPERHASVSGIDHQHPVSAKPRLIPQPPPPGQPWPRWATSIVTVIILVHATAVLAGVLGVPPSSNLEQAIADKFTGYFDLLDMGYSYRFYAEPPPTPVVIATIHFPSAPDQTVRLPGRNLAGPRMRHQRQLALANALFGDAHAARHQGQSRGQSPLARAYARHLCLAYPGCKSVTLHLQQHLMPDPELVRQVSPTLGSSGFDLFAESMFTAPEWIGDYPCDSF
jgi:hypothetical protein